MTSHELHMEPVHEPNAQFHVFDSYWRELSRHDPAALKHIEGITTYRDDLVLIDRIRIEKSVRLQGLEASARSFIQSLGFRDLPPLFLLGEGKELQSLGFEAAPSVVAVVDPLGRYATVRSSRIEQIVHEHGDVKAASVLTHELMHLANAPKHITLSRTKTGRKQLTERDGFAYATKNQEGGMFIEEAIAAYFSGVFVRLQESPQHGLVSFAALPKPVIPAHYVVGSYESDGFAEHVMGPDGYALELIMWKLEKDGIMSSEDFVSGLLQSRRSSTQASGMRCIIQGLNALEPGLYAKLSRVQYGKENWRSTCAGIYELVTGGVWGADDLMTGHDSP